MKVTQADADGRTSYDYCKKTKSVNFETVKAYIKDFPRTCSNTNLKNNSIALIASEAQFDYVANKVLERKWNVLVICDWLLDGDGRTVDSRGWGRMHPLFAVNPMVVFFQIHNYINKLLRPKINEYAKSVRLHPTVVVGTEGMRYFFEQDSQVPIPVKHMGNVILGRRVSVGAYSVINRAVFDSTIIWNDCKIGSFVNIGHNTIIRNRTAITPHVCIGGSVLIGEDCWIGMNATIRDHVHICNGVKIGMGSLVVKDIREPGLYYGSPAKRKGDWDGKW